MSGPQAVGTLDAGLIGMDTDVMSARSYSSDVEDGLRLAPDDSDADDTAAVPWPQLPLPDLGSGDANSGGGSWEAASGASSIVANTTAAAASPVALLDTSHTNGSAARGLQTADVPMAAADARLRHGSSRGADVKSGRPTLYLCDCLFLSVPQQHVQTSDPEVVALRVTGPPALQPFSGQVGKRLLLAYLIMSCPPHGLYMQLQNGDRRAGGEKAASVEAATCLYTCMHSLTAMADKLM